MKNVAQQIKSFSILKISWKGTFFILVLNNGRNSSKTSCIYYILSFTRLFFLTSFASWQGKVGFAILRFFRSRRWSSSPLCHRTRRQSFQPQQWHPRGRPWGQTRPQARPLDRRLDGNGTVRKQGWRQNTSGSTVIELNLLRFNPSVCKPRRFNRGSSWPWMQEWVSLMKIFFVILSRVLEFNAFCSVHFGEVIISDIFFIWGITIHSIHFNM